MSQDINKEAFKQAEKELLENKVKEVKGYILETLNKIESKKKQKALVEEELRVLKLDLEDLRHGNFDKIEERREKSKVARAVGFVVPSAFLDIQSAYGTNTNENWTLSTAGTYLTNTGSAVYLSAN